ncbi:hypothetical protein GLOTRDRAFT_119628 [Gloeophyllum trabeum ATCC 11539]|uniref:Transcription initiation factor TFIID subunit 8 n=1 Tax=Gloeophyllum trabeum (strain ATCC 11539 / FP-39264 / Madison 617) TaxID=670483 RepID=S7QK27_GLOTA|nr:uncharacterized protein GLOTRDRAFT_119628 [Gloeophyllum trabeum ATCC 11539]EPQ59583.1 hypothetical protein GLOTRDRAFT_119628 [Gloeophyllum trabeum ATCC 11539]
MSYSTADYSQSYGHYPSQAYQYTPAQYQPPQYQPSAQGQYGVYSQYTPQFAPSSPSKFKSSPQPDPLSPPDLSSISPKVASQATQRLISTQLKSAGFDAAESIALQRLEAEVVAFVSRIYEQAHEYANLANRAKPIAKDLLLAQEECGLEIAKLRQIARKTKKRKSQGEEGYEPIALEPAPPRSPSPELLPSDDETNPVLLVPATLRTLPYENMPPLPPKHTYLRTPPSPPKKAAPSSLEKKLKNAGLVQESLKNLLLATEDTTGQEDGELLGHIVNWEAHIYPRKRWRVGV